MLIPLSFSTRDSAQPDQFASWRIHMEAVCEVTLPEDISPTDGFIVEHTAWNLGGMLVVQQNVPAHGYVRSQEQLRSSSIDHWTVVLLRSGCMWTEVDGRVAINRPGEVHIGSLGYPYRGRMTSSEALILFLPRNLFAQSSPQLDQLNNAVLRGNSAILLADHLKSVEARLSSMTAEVLPLVVNATRDMILTCLDPAVAEGSPGDQVAGMALMERARRFVQSRLSDKDLTPADMARALGVSRTRLYQLFEHSGGVLHYIQKRRLHAAHVALSDPDDERRITDVAEATGFTSAASFSRAFGKEFGYSPRQSRNKSLASRSIRARNIPRPEHATFTDWLKALD